MTGDGEGGARRAGKNDLIRRFADLRLSQRQKIDEELGAPRDPRASNTDQIRTTFTHAQERGFIDRLAELVTAAEGGAS